MFLGGEAPQTKISTIIKVFSNQQVLVTITDNDKFGNTYSAKKVSLESQGLTDPMVLMMYGGDTGGMGDPFEDEDDIYGSGDPGNPLPKDTIET